MYIYYFFTEKVLLLSLQSLKVLQYQIQSWKSKVLQYYCSNTEKVKKICSKYGIATIAVLQYEQAVGGRPPQYAPAPLLPLWAPKRLAPQSLQTAT